MSCLILTVTRRCNYRCSYCPTVKDGWPSLEPADAVRAVDLFVRELGGGDVKLFGGEPLLVPEVVRAAMDAAAERPEIRRVYLSTNGVGLDDEWLAYLARHPKSILTISIDGSAEAHRRSRRALPGVADSYDAVGALLPVLLRTPRVVITQTIPPALAASAADNFRHLRSLGFTRFNLLPGYYIPWTEPQLAALAAGFDEIRSEIEAAWQAGAPLYLRNLFTSAPTPFFNTGMVVDADRSIHPSNVGLSGLLDELLPLTRAGDLDHPPTRRQLEEKAAAVNDLLVGALPPGIWAATQAVDAELTRLCRGLMPAYLAHRRERRARRPGPPEARAAG